MYERRDNARKEFISNTDIFTDTHDEVDMVTQAFNAGWKARKELDYKPMTDIS